jgi:putative membrane-bound dehydrogenase-like protein
MIAFRRAAGPLLVLVVAMPSPAQEAPATPEQAAARMKVAEGFHVTQFAAEPHLAKPIAMTTDDRGRLWVIESRCYPHWRTNGSAGNDRILIFEDRAGSGHFDSCKVFWDRGTNLSGLAVGFGGVWLCATPHLLFIPVRPGEDKPAGPPVVVLDGWDLRAKHNVFNTLVWGPDGWLYGCNGILSNSHIGRPGTPEAQRVFMNCGVWRYHPVLKRVEAFAWGTTNPWGLDFDDRGEMFITNCVIKHLFHVIPGAHYQRMFGQDVNPYCYGLIEGCADHLHWAGGDWTSSRGGQGAHSESGGGHAHAGCMVYLGDNWPDSYRNHLFTCNIHGNRVNQDILQRHGSGYVARHATDFLLANDPWFRGLTILYGPDGGVYCSDWCDTGECHNYDQVHSNTGRIYKITYGNTATVAVDLIRQSDEDLVRLQLHKNDWWVQHARRVLQERAHAGKLSATVRPALLRMLTDQADETRKLRALWALHGIGGLDEKTQIALLDAPQETLRGWAVRLLAENGSMSEEAAKRLAELARTEPAASVRLALASALQRLPTALRWAIAEALAGRAADAADPNLPLMIWYGVESLVPADPDRAARFLMGACIPLVRQYIARRLAAAGEGLQPLVRLLESATDGALQRDVLRGMYEALQGRRFAAPAGWKAVAHMLSGGRDAEVREKALLLSVLFGDAEAIAALRKTAADPQADAAARRQALQALVETRASDLLLLLRSLLADRVMRGPTLRALSAERDPAIPALILDRYAALTDAEKADAIATLASRPESARALLDAMGKGLVARRDLSPFTARQLLAFKDPGLAEQLARVWGSIRPPAREKAALLTRYLSLVPPTALEKADRGRGRQLFAKTCATCHKLFGEGTAIGPDLTGSQRTHPEYVLSKVLDPSAVVGRDYQVTIINTVDGRTLTGLVKQETDKTLTLQTQNEVVPLAKTDIEERRRSEASMMPDGLLAPLSDIEVRDLIAYLAGAGQVRLPR